ncbi:MAG: UvrD-helicase domain-containing protein, partial [Opitutaceae bacterium]
GKALENWEALGRGDAVLEFNRKKQELSAAACSALRALVKHIVRAEILRRLETTRGIHAIIDGYERVYHDAVRRAGQLTFADVQRLLQQDDVIGLTSGATPEGLSRAERRMLIDWRLDGQFEHWLLDEFQDTSAGQWSVLKNLIDEVVQDDSGRRTLFYVGDVKQAIYAWREGDARLFREIFKYYNAAAPGAIVERRLDRSFRSGPAILAMVNTVFGDPAVLSSLFPAEAARRWSEEWREHQSAVPDRRGHSAWIFAEDQDARFEATLQILQEIDPIGRGLTAAVLTQSNNMAAELADHLRRAGLRAVAESDLHVCTDNPLTVALLALFKAAAHPGDSLAREHVRMTPLAREIEALGGHERDAVTRELLRSIHNDGFEATVEEWLRRLEPMLAADDIFSRERGRQMAEAARLFDESGSRDVAEFI